MLDTASQTPFTYWKDLADLIKTILESVAIIAGALVVIKWFAERHDRATDVLLQLETRFQDPELQHACRILEDEETYLTTAPLLQKVVRLGANLWPDSEINKCAAGDVKNDPAIKSSRAESLLSWLFTQPAENTSQVSNDLAAIDKLLRFYVVMHGVRKARQIPDAALRTCYRYWLAHYFHPRRPDFRAYVNQFYPTLRSWLACEKNWYQRAPSRPHRFFRAADFWDTRKGYMYAQLRKATEGRVLVIVGAGLSAESGIPTFRGRGALWRDYDPKQLAMKSAFKKNPEQVWEFYRERRRKVRSHKPNKAHKALVALSERARDPKDFLVVTQNVDHYEIDAGLDPQRVVQIHGDILTTRCFNDKCDYRTRLNDTESHDSVPKCPTCKAANLRPDVVWFDEDFRPGDEERVKTFLAQGLCDAVFIIGTSATFGYIADWALSAVKPTGWLIEINPHPSDIGRFAHQVYCGKAGRVLPKLLKQLSKGEPPKRLSTIN